MYTSATLVPAITFALLFLLLSVFYPLGKTNLAKMQGALAERREISATTHG